MFLTEFPIRGVQNFFKKDVNLPIWEMGKMALLKFGEILNFICLYLRNDASNEKIYGNQICSTWNLLSDKVKKMQIVGAKLI